MHQQPDASDGSRTGGAAGGHCGEGHVGVVEDQEVGDPHHAAPGEPLWRREALPGGRGPGVLPGVDPRLLCQVPGGSPHRDQPGCRGEERGSRSRILALGLDPRFHTVDLKTLWMNPTVRFGWSLHERGGERYQLWACVWYVSVTRRVSCVGHCLLGSAVFPS